MPLLVMLIALIIGGASCKSNKSATDISSTKDNEREERTEETLKDKNAKDAIAEEDTSDEEEDVMSAKDEAENKLQDYFRAIANAPSVASANRSIEEALNLFDSDDALVLIVINNSGGKKDYDRPTTIKEYLNYLKDQKKNINRVGTLKLNSSDKITELELIKK